MHTRTYIHKHINATVCVHTLEIYTDTHTHSQVHVLVSPSQVSRSRWDSACTSDGPLRAPSDPSARLMLHI